MGAAGSGELGRSHVSFWFHPFYARASRFVAASATRKYAKVGAVTQTRRSGLDRLQVARTHRKMKASERQPPGTSWCPQPCPEGALGTRYPAEES